MKKSLFLIILLIALFALLTLSASAFTVEVRDDIGILDFDALAIDRDAEASEMLQDTRFGILTTMSLYRDDYPSNSSVRSRFDITAQESAVILVLRLLGDTYYYDIYLYGEADEIFSDADVDAVLDDTGVYSNLKGGRFEAGAQSFFSLCADVLQEHYEKLAAREARAPLVAVIVGVIAAVTVGGGSVLGVVLYYRKKRHGETYPLDRYARLRLTAREDRFVGSFVTRTRIQRNSGSHGGRGGSGGGGGGGRRGGR
ncbi:MAG: hypothetical protein E7639_00825 [Ruminococcaceae bacterium]|nr:hypothetical protein [Oscillospiraceae bacterium]